MSRPSPAGWPGSCWSCRWRWPSPTRWWFAAAPRPWPSLWLRWAWCGRSCHPRSWDRAVESRSAWTIRSSTWSGSTGCSACGPPRRPAGCRSSCCVAAASRSGWSSTSSSGKRRSSSRTWGRSSRAWARSPAPRSPARGGWSSSSIRPCCAKPSPR